MKQLTKQIIIQEILDKISEKQESITDVKFQNIIYFMNNIDKTVNEEEVKDALQFNSYRSLFDIGHLIKKPSYSKPDKVVDKIVDNDGDEIDFDDI